MVLHDDDSRSVHIRPARSTGRVHSLFRTSGPLEPKPCNPDKVGRVMALVWSNSMQIDVHQHIWTEPLLDALAARRRLPFVRRSRGLTVLHCADERPYVIDVGFESPEQRAGLLHADGLDVALIALSSPTGIEALSHEVASELISAHLDGVLSLSDEFAAWGPIAIDQPEPDEVDDVLARGCVGVSLPAAALAGPPPPAGVWAGPRAGGRAKRAIADPSRPQRAPGNVRGVADRAAVVASADRLRGPDAGGLDDVHRAGPARASPAHRPVRDARRRRAAAQPAAPHPGRPGRPPARPP